MAIYEFHCMKCNLYFTASTVEPEACPLGHKVVKRKYSFAFHRGYEGGFNHSVGTYVKNSHDLDEKLKAASHYTSEDLGLEHKFVQADPRDFDRMSVKEVDDAPRPKEVVGEGGWVEVAS